MSKYFFTYYENPGYVDLVREEVKVVGWHYAEHWPDNYTFPGSFVQDFRSYYFFELAELKPILAWAAFFTILRYFFERFICRPLVKSLNLDSAEDRKKFPESLWKCITYSFFWAYCAYLLLVKYDYFLRPYALWIDWTHGMSVADDIKLLYFIECGFYVHSVYATLFMDAVRKDFVAMLIHHVLTLALINVSYSTRYHKIGILVIFCHDVTDILLEYSKCNFYMKRRNGKFYRHNDLLATIGFAAFTLVWFVFRLYWYPLKIMYSAGCAAPHVLWYRGGGLYEFFNTLLWLLLLLDVYWFYYILKILFKALGGGEMSDSREAEFDQKKGGRAETEAAVKSSGKKVD